MISPGEPHVAQLPAVLAERVRAWRHHLHQIPETAFAEHQTSAFVAGVLRDLGSPLADTRNEQHPDLQLQVRVSPMS